MALTPTKGTAEDKSTSDPEVNKETGQGGPADGSAELAALTERATAAESKVEELPAQVAQLSNGNDQALADLRAEHESAVATLKDEHLGALSAKSEEINQLKADLETAKAAAKDKPAAKPAKPKIMTVISLTQYNYKLDGVTVTPDIPVKAEWYPGNLLDSHMQAKLIGEYGAEE